MLLGQPRRADDRAGLVHVGLDLVDLLARVAEGLERLRHRAGHDRHLSAAHQLLELDEPEIGLDAGRVAVHQERDRAGGSEHRIIETERRMHQCSRGYHVGGVALMSTLHHLLAQKFRHQYDPSYVAQYRTRDDDVNHPNHRDLCEILTSVSSEMSGPLRVLDAGCGTGRYFHCLRQTGRILGMDISTVMLQAARRPVRADQIQGDIQLICGNLFEVQFQPGSFHLIACMGVLGHLVPLEAEWLRKVHGWLAPRGRLVFTCDDAASPSANSWKRTLYRHLGWLLPSPLQARIDTRIGDFRLGEEDLCQRVKGSPFSHYCHWKRYSGTGRIDWVVVAER